MKTLASAFFLVALSANGQEKFCGAAPISAPPLPYATVAVAANVSGSVVLALNVQRGDVIAAYPIFFAHRMLLQISRNNVLLQPNWPGWKFPADFTGLCEVTIQFVLTAKPVNEDDRYLLNKENAVLTVVAEMRGPRPAEPKLEECRVHPDCNGN